MAPADLGHVFDQKRQASRGCFDHNGLQLLGGADHAFGSNRQLGGIAVDIGTAGVLVVGLNGIVDFLKGDPLGLEFIGANADFDLLEQAPKTAHIRNAWNPQQGSTDLPILQGAQFR